MRVLGVGERAGLLLGERGVQMKIITWNVRGLSAFEKRKEVRKLVGEKKPTIVCIKETKLAKVDDFICSSVWGNSPCGFSFQPSIGASGGLPTMWDSDEVEISYSLSFEHVLAVGGRFLHSLEDFVVFNLYALCDVGSQVVLWGTLSTKLESFTEKNVCVCGDLNAVRSVEERWSVGSMPRMSGVASFNIFIDDNDFVDLPLIGRRLTWYRGDGRSMSRLDRFLLFDSWCARWQNCIQVAQLRGLSDHCALVLSVDEQNWGPRPFRVLKC